MPLICVTETCQFFLAAEKIYFTKELEDTKVKEVGKSATLVCEISKDGLKVDWYHGKTKLRRGEDYDIVASGKTHKLVIEKVTEDLTGDYRAEYKTATTNCSLQLAGESGDFDGIKEQRILCQFHFQVCSISLKV